MANQIIIDIGAVANDGTGDPLRTAFGYVNNNFSNIWTTGVANSNIAFDGNRILTTNTNGNLVLAPNGIGKVQSNVDIVPNANNTLSLGSLTNQWNTVYAQNLTVGGDTTFNNLTVNGNLTVDGDIIQIGNLVTDAKTIQLANTAATDAAANGSGITVGALDDVATLLYNSTSDVWTTNIGITATGNITGTYFIGNGSLLTGITSYGNANVAEYLPTYNGNIGANYINVVNNVNAQNDIIAKRGTFSGDPVTGDASLYIGSPTFTALGTDVMAQFTGNVPNYAQINLQNYGNLPTASGDYIITADNGTDSTHFLDLGLTGSTWDGTQPNSLGNRLGPNDGYLYVQDGDFVLGTSNGTIETWKFDQTGNLTVPGDIIPAGNNTQSLGNATNQWSDLWVSNATIYMNSVPITLGAGNVLTVDGEAVLTNDSATTITTTGNITADYFIGDGSLLTGISSTGNITFTDTTMSPPDGVDITISAANSEVIIEAFDIRLDATDDLRLTGNDIVSLRNLSTTEPVTIITDYNNTEKTWEFGADGSLTTPGDVTVAGDVTGTVGASTLVLRAQPASNTSIQLNDSVDSVISTVANLEIRTDVSNTAQTWEFDNAGTLTAPGTITTSGNVDAANFNGGNLFNMTLGSRVLTNGLPIQGGAYDYSSLYVGFDGGDNGISLNSFGNAPVQINTGDGGANTYNWTFSNSTGNLTLPNGGSIIVDGGDGVVGPDGDNMVISWDNEELILRSVAGDVDVEADNDFNIRVNYDGGANDYLTKWVFAQDNEIVNITGNSTIVTEAGNLNLQGGRNTLSSGNVQITAVNNGVAVNTWTFDNAGVLTAPGNITTTGNIITGNGANIVLGNSASYIKQQASNATINLGGSITLTPDTSASALNGVVIGGLGYLLAPNGSRNAELNYGGGSGTMGIYTVNIYGNAATAITNGGANGVGNIGANSTNRFNTAFLTAVDASGNITGGNLITAGRVSASGNILGLNFGTEGSVQASSVEATGNISGANLSVTGNISGNTSGYAIGYRDIPQVSFTGNATIATTDAGKHFYSTQSTDYILTIANNASQGFQVGAAITVVNQGTGNITIAQGSGVTLYLAGNASSGNRSVATFGMATIMKVATDTWFISGAGVA